MIYSLVHELRSVSAGSSRLAVLVADIWLLCEMLMSSRVTPRSELPRQAEPRRRSNVSEGEKTRKSW